MRLRSHETPTTERPFIDPMAARNAGYVPPHGPPAPGELGGVHEVAPLQVESRALSINGLRRSIADRRANRAEAKVGPASRKATFRRNMYERIIEGRVIPFDERIDDRLPQTPLDKLDRVARKIRHPDREPQPWDNYGASSSWWDSRRERKLLDRRGRRRMHEMEAEIRYKRQAKPVDSRENNRDFSVVPDAETSDLGTDLGWKRFYTVPRTGLDRRGQVRAIESVHHAAHKAHSMNERAERPVKKAEKKAGNHQDKADRLREHKKRIAARQDVVSRVYDSTKRKAKSGAIKTAKTGKKYVGGIASAPRQYREARDGGADNNGRVQERINRVARSLGQRRGRRKASAS